MYVRSGLPSRSGVGTVITATSKPMQLRGSTLARYRPLSSAAESRSGVTSST
jgi:hypothetical protein